MEKNPVIGEPEKPPCREALAAMYMFLDREMQDAAIADIQSHIDECAPCLEAFEFEADLKALIATKCREDMPTHLYERIKISITVAKTTHNETSGNVGIPPV